MGDLVVGPLKVVLQLLQVAFVASVELEKVRMLTQQE